MAPQWLKNAVIDGLQALLVLRLRGSPAKDTLPALANLWFATITTRPITWDEDRDAPRIKKAFLELMATAEHWPAPSAFLGVLPPPPPTYSLPGPVDRNMSPETRKMVDDMLAKMRRTRTEPSE